MINADISSRCNSAVELRKVCSTAEDVAELLSSGSGFLEGKSITALASSRTF